MADVADRSKDFNASALAAHKQQAEASEEESMRVLLSDFCEGCGERIPIARRNAQPGCLFCIDCAD